MTKQEAPWPYRHRTRSRPDRRAERRLLCSDLIEVCWSAPSGARRSEMAIVEDYSRGGASLFLGVPVEPMADVSLATGSHTFRGVVRHCSPQPNGYIVGVEFESPRSHDDYVPEHVLDVTRLDFTPEEE